jgi:hypothetical protein
MDRGMHRPAPKLIEILVGKNGKEMMENCGYLDEKS